MVRAEAIGKRGGGKKLNAMNPWSPNHTANVSTDRSRLGDKAKFYGSSGPGSSHSWLALAIGASKQRNLANAENSNPFPQSYTAAHALDRRIAGTRSAFHWRENAQYNPAEHVIADSHHSTMSLMARANVHTALEHTYGRENVHEVHQDPRKWAR